MKNWPYPRVAAHRGGGTLAPENTLAGFRCAAQYGHAMVEFDVKLSADCVALLLHDDTLERTSNGRGAAARQRYADLATLDAGRWYGARFAGERIPTLAQAAACCEALTLAANVEIKPCPGRDDETGRLVAQEAERLWLHTWSRVRADAGMSSARSCTSAPWLHVRADAGASSSPPPLLSSFSSVALAAARAAVPVLPRGLLVGCVPVDWRAQTAALGCASLHADHRFLSEPLVARIRAAGLFVLAYTVNDLERARQLAQWGVDTVCTDRLDLIGPRAPDPDALARQA